MSKRLETKKLNQERRKNMDIKAIQLKIVHRRLSRASKEFLDRLFLEAKWFENYLLSQEDGAVFENNFSTEKSVPVYYKTEGCSEWLIEEREFSSLGSHMKQEIQAKIMGNINGLSQSKKNGLKVGRLKFKSEVNSVPLKEFDNTYKLNFTKQSIRIQKHRRWLRVRGMDQFKPGDEFANAKLVRKPNGIYLHVTIYRNPEPVNRKDQVLGIDFGLENNFILSNGLTVNVQLRETERLKFLQRKLTRQEKGSNNWWKTKKSIQKEYQKINNRKIEATNQFISYIKQEFKYIFFQDENLSAWKRRKGYVRGGKKIQHSIMGRVKQELQKLDGAVMLPRYTPTTAWCPVCGNKTSHAVDKRTFSCPHCGHELDRDLHAALNMIILGVSCATEHSASKNEIVRFFEEGLKALVEQEELTEADTIALVTSIKQQASFGVKQEDVSSLAAH